MGNLFCEICQCFLPERKLVNHVESLHVSPRHEEVVELQCSDCDYTVSFFDKLAAIRHCIMTKHDVEKVKTVWNNFIVSEESRIVEVLKLGKEILVEKGDEDEEPSDEEASEFEQSSTSSLQLNRARNSTETSEIIPKKRRGRPSKSANNLHLRNSQDLLRTSARNINTTTKKKNGDMGTSDRHLPEEPLTEEPETDLNIGSHLESLEQTDNESNRAREHPGNQVPKEENLDQQDHSEEEDLRSNHRRSSECEPVADPATGKQSNHSEKEDDPVKTEAVDEVVQSDIDKTPKEQKNSYEQNPSTEELHEAAPRKSHVRIDSESQISKDLPQMVDNAQCNDMEASRSESSLDEVRNDSLRYNAFSGLEYSAPLVSSQALDLVSLKKEVDVPAGMLTDNEDPTEAVSKSNQRSLDTDLECDLAASLSSNLRPSEIPVNLQRKERNEDSIQDVKPELPILESSISELPPPKVSVAVAQESAPSKFNKKRIPRVQLREIEGDINAGDELDESTDILDRVAETFAEFEEIETQGTKTPLDPKPISFKGYSPNSPAANSEKRNKRVRTSDATETLSHTKKICESKPKRATRRKGEKNEVNIQAKRGQRSMDGRKRNSPIAQACQSCNVTMTLSGDREKDIVRAVTHVLSHEPPIRTFRCKICGHESIEREGLELHAEVVHPDIDIDMVIVDLGSEQDATEIYLRLGESFPYSIYGFAKNLLNYRG